LRRSGWASCRRRCRSTSTGGARTASTRSSSTTRRRRTSRRRWTIRGSSCSRWTWPSSRCETHPPGGRPLAWLRELGAGRGVRDRERSSEREQHLRRWCGFQAPRPKQTGALVERRNQSTQAARGQAHPPCRGFKTQSRSSQGPPVGDATPAARVFAATSMPGFPLAREVCLGWRACPPAQPGTPAVGYHQLSRDSSTYTTRPAGNPSSRVPPAVERPLHLHHTPSREPQQWGTTSCREAAPLTPHAQPGTPAVGYHQLSRDSSTILALTPPRFPLQNEGRGSHGRHGPRVVRRHRAELQQALHGARRHHHAATLRLPRRARVARAGDAATNKLRIVTLGISGGRSLTGPFRDARRFPSTRWYLVPGATCTTLGLGICPSFKDHSLSRRAKP
jgi:hypothetical protein